jgi:hypothetical protein
MRKFFRISALAALALGVTALTAQAQEKTFGLVAGVDFANITGNDFSDGLSTRTGFMGGFFFGIPAGTSLVIEPELLYTMKGAKYDNSAFTGSYNIDYFEIPVLVKYNFNPEGGFYIMAGPSISFNVSCKDKGTDNFDDSTYDESCKDQGATPNTVFGGVLGLGFSKGHIGIEGRYDLAFGNALKITDAGGGDDTIDGKTNAWAILVRLTK